MKKKLIKIYNIKLYTIVLLNCLFFMVILMFYKSLFALIPFVIIIFIGTLLIANYFSLNNTIKNITTQDIDLIEKEIRNPLLSKPFCYYLTEHYIIIKSLLYFNIVKYEDIILVYKQKIFNGVSLSESLILITNKKKRIVMPLNYHYFLYSMLMSELTKEEKIIRLKNNKILFGYNQENLNKIKAEYGLIFRK